MPQLDFAVFFSEISWLILLSIFIYIFYSNYFTPVIFKMIQFVHYKMVENRKLELKLCINFYLQKEFFYKSVTMGYKDAIIYFIAV